MPLHTRPATVDCRPPVRALCCLVQAEVPKIPEDEMMYVQQMLQQLQKSQAAQKAAQAQVEQPEEAQPPVGGQGPAQAWQQGVAAAREGGGLGCALSTAVAALCTGGPPRRCGGPLRRRARALMHLISCIAHVRFISAGPDRRVDPAVCGPAQGALRHRPRQAPRVPGGAPAQPSAAGASCPAAAAAATAAAGVVAAAVSPLQRRCRCCPPRSHLPSLISTCLALCVFAGWPGPPERRLHLYDERGRQGAGAAGAGGGEVPGQRRCQPAAAAARWSAGAAPRPVRGVRSADRLPSAAVLTAAAALPLCLSMSRPCRTRFATACTTRPPCTRYVGGGGGGSGTAWMDRYWSVSIAAAKAGDRALGARQAGWPCAVHSWGNPDGTQPVVSPCL